MALILAIFCPIFSPIFHSHFIIKLLPLYFFSSHLCGMNIRWNYLWLSAFSASKTVLSRGRDVCLFLPFAVLLRFVGDFILLLFIYFLTLLCYACFCWCLSRIVALGCLLLHFASCFCIERCLRFCFLFSFLALSLCLPLCSPPCLPFGVSC